MVDRQRGALDIDQKIFLPIINSTILYINKLLDLEALLIMSYGTPPPKSCCFFSLTKAGYYIYAQVRGTAVRFYPN